jgi:hypothetical protein
MDKGAELVLQPLWTAASASPDMRLSMQCRQGERCRSMGAMFEIKARLMILY